MKRQLATAAVSLLAIGAVPTMSAAIFAPAADAASVSTVCLGQDKMVDKAVHINSTAFTLTYVHTYSMPPASALKVTKTADHVATLTTGTTKDGEASAGISWPLVQAGAKAGFTLSKSGETSTTKSISVEADISAHRKAKNEVFFEGYKKVTGTWSAYDCSRSPHHGTYMSGTFHSWGKTTVHSGAAQCGYKYPAYDSWDKVAQFYGCH